MFGSGLVSRLLGLVLALCLFFWGLAFALFPVPDFGSGLVSGFLASEGKKLELQQEICLQNSCAREELVRSPERNFRMSGLYHMRYASSNTSDGDEDQNGDDDVLLLQVLVVVVVVAVSS